MKKIYFLSLTFSSLIAQAEITSSSATINNVSTIYQRFTPGITSSAKIKIIGSMSLGLGIAAVLSWLLLKKPSNNIFNNQDDPKKQTPLHTQIVVPITEQSSITSTPPSEISTTVVSNQQKDIESTIQKMIDNARELYENDDEEKALSMVNEALGIQRTNAELQNLHGLCLEATGNQGAALNAYTIAIELDPTNIDFLIDRADLCYTLKLNEHAVQDIQKIEELDPEYANFDEDEKTSVLELKEKCQLALKTN